MRDAIQKIRLERRLAFTYALLAVAIIVVIQFFAALIAPDASAPESLPVTAETRP